MDRFPVREQNHPEVSIPSLRNPGPSPDPLIRLDIPMFRALDGPNYPLVLDQRSIWTGACGIEIFSGFHVSGTAAA